ncbi:unnamed protein product, partial [Meganyctiphanes norvegica]
AFCWVKFKNVHSVYKAYRLIKGTTIYSKDLNVVVPMVNSFTKEEKAVKKSELSEKQVFDHIINHINGMAKKEEKKKKKLLKGYLKSATQEEQSRLLSKNAVGKEEIGGEESITDAKEMEKNVKQNLSQAFDLEAASSPIDSCATADEHGVTKEYDHLNEEYNYIKSWQTESDKRTKNKPYDNCRLEGKKDNENKRSRSPSNKQRYRSRSKDRKDRSQKI